MENIFVVCYTYKCYRYIQDFNTPLPYNISTRTSIQENPKVIKRIHKRIQDHTMMTVTLQEEFCNCLQTSSSETRSAEYMT